METIVIFLLYGIIGFYLVALVGGMILHYRLRRVHRELGRVLERAVEQAVEQNTIIMRIEHDPAHGYFAYRIGDGEFLAHGSTVEDMQKNFAARFPNKSGLVPTQPGLGSEFVRAAN